MASVTAQSNLKSDLHSAWKQSLNRLTATSHSDSSTPPLQKLVSVGRAWTVVQAHYTTNLQSSDASTVTPTQVVEALNLLSQAGQSTAVSNWYLSYLETQLPERIQLLLEPLSSSYQSTSSSNVSSVSVVSQSLVLELKKYLSPIHQGLFGISQDQSNLIRIYQTILHSQISKNPSFQTSLLKVLSKSFLTISTSTSDVTSIAIDNNGDGDEIRELISNLIILGLGSFLKTKFNTISSEKIKSKVIRLVDDGTWKSKQIPQDESKEEDQDGIESIGTSSSSLLVLKDWLNETLIPSFRNWIDLIHKLEGETRKQNQNLGFQDGDQGREVEMELEEDPSTNQTGFNAATSKDQISKGMEYQMLKILCEVRSHQLFDLVADWPESKPALLDLKECLIHPELKNSVTKTYSQALKIRLLHPGAGTQDIIQIYVHMIRSLREIDPSGVILSLIVPPIRSYLRGRKDTITVIVSGLIGTGESTLLRQELETPVNDNNNNNKGQSSVGILESEENVSRSAGIKNLEEYDSDYDDDDDGDFGNGVKPDWDDENWFPRPIDAGPNYNQSKNEDIINILITIFDDRLGFIKALEQTTAESLIKVRNYDSTREYRNNIILKRRFGSEAIGHCDVMLSDITASRRLDSSIRSLYVNEWSHSGPDSPILPSPHPTCLSIKERETFDNLHPLILSKQFWPEFGSSSSSDSSNAYNVNNLALGNVNAGGDKVEFPKLGSGLDIGSGKGSENLKMPGQFVKALEVYQHYFSRLKDTRKLKWLLNVGKVKLELEMKDGRVLEEEVTPLQAAVIELASEGSASESNPISDQSASQILNVEKAAALNALYFWSSKGILRELQNTPGSFEILEGDAEDGKEKEKGKDQDEEMTG